LHAKVDTGALTSALHVENLNLWEDGLLTFDVVGCSRRPNEIEHVQARLLRMSEVRSTNGGSAARPVVRTRLCLGPLEREMELGLVDRSSMNYPMLLGRSALAGVCVVDPSASFLLS
jgi:hypothetical protein